MLSKSRIGGSVGLLLLLCFAIWQWNGIEGASMVPPETVQESATGNAAAAVASTVDSGGVDNPRRRESRFALRVVDVRRSSVAGCVVECWADGGRELGKLSADEVGRVSYPGLDESGVVVVSAPGRPPMSVRFESLRGDHEVVLPDGLSLEGIVFVDGQPAGQGLRLTLRSLREDLQTVLPPRSDLVRQRDVAVVVVETSAEGRFRILGLAEDWRGELWLPESHWVLPNDAIGTWTPNRIPMAAPVRAVNLYTTALPIVRGQVRVASDGAPMAGAELGIRVELAGGVSCGASCISDAAGSFQAVLVPDVDALHRQWCEPERRPAFAHGTVVCVRGPGLAGPVTVELAARHLAGEPVLVAVELAPRVHFRATSQDGSPVVAARVNVALSEPGDLDGRGWYQGATNELLVGAVDSCVVPAVAHGGLGSEQHPVQFTLPARNTLRIAVVDRQGRTAEVASVQLHASGPIFVGGRSQTAFDEQFGASAFAMQMAGRRRSSDGTTNPYWRGECKPGANAVIVLHSLEPGVRIDAVARDAFGMELASATVQAPSFGEARDLALVVDADLRSIRGRVLASSGGPVVGARVAVEADGRRLELVVGEDGSFRSAPFRISAPVQVRAVAEGFAPASTWIDARSAADSAVELRLEIGHSVTVTVVGDRGEPVAVYAYPVGFEREQAQVLSLGVFQWASLPSRVVFRAELSGRHFEIEHDARQPTVQLRVPTPAQVLAPLAGLPPGAGVGATDSLVVLRLLDDEAARPVRLAWAQAEQAPTSVLPGRYRATVVRRGGAEGSEIETGIGREFVLPAGVLTQLDFGK